jgi:hypothetical protein
MPVPVASRRETTATLRQATRCHNGGDRIATECYRVLPVDPRGTRVLIPAHVLREIETQAAATCSFTIEDGASALERALRSSPSDPRAGLH